MQPRAGAHRPQAARPTALTSRWRPNTFTYPGHAFVGWNDGTSTYPEGWSYVLSSPVTFTAQWETGDDYSYASGGATGGSAPASGSAPDGNSIKLAADTFTCPGHAFVGWNDGTATYPAGYSVPVR